MTSSFNFGSRLLRAHQAQNDGRAFRRETKRSEITGTLVVVFEEESIDLHLVKQDFGDGLIAAARDPCALEIAAAEMHADCHVGRFVADRIVDELAIESRQRVGIVTAGLGASADVGIAKIGKVGVVELQVAAAAPGEIRDLLAISGGEIVEESFHLRVHVVADRVTAAAKMQHRGGWNADLGRARDDRLQEIEVRPLNRRNPFHLAADMHGRRLESNRGSVVLLEVRHELAVAGFDALQPL